MGGRLSLDKCNAHRPPQHGGSLVVLGLKRHGGLATAANWTCGPKRDPNILHYATGFRVGSSKPSATKDSPYRGAYTY
ncbi:hypothetical protein TNCV_187091 [Trichonephila clavipes]|nr:hypothetical protein TNCV_187091 [Trichonephila clavipes]